MTYARYLALGGFKAFRDWNLLDLSPRVSVLVGRNGSGKSTLIEALLWTLGETDLGLLRAEEETDLLYRPPAEGLRSDRTEREQHLLFLYPPEEDEEGVECLSLELAGGRVARTDPAEAAEEEEGAVAYLVLGDETDAEADEGDGEPACCCKAVREQGREVPEGLITVKRRLAPAGSRNTYLLDGVEASREEVQRALASHGLDRASVSVIRQGELERVLLAEPQLRARILAEAAGLELKAGDDEEILVLQLEHELLLTRLTDLEQRLRVLHLRPEAEPAEALQGAEDGSSRLASLQAGLVSAVVQAWGTEHRLPGGGEQLLGLLGFSVSSASRKDSLPAADLEALLTAAEVEQRLWEHGNAAAKNGLREPLQEEKNLLTESLSRVELDFTRAISAAGREQESLRQRLGAVHARVEERFSRFFSMLVSGGKVELPLDLGDGLRGPALDIRVAFPDSGFERLEALSGGQRSLVAFALGLALFLETPSRLMVLDEVEPALDDSNVRRFNQLLHEVAKTRQVVLVSHQRRTKDVGDVVFGVDVTGNGASMLHYRFEPATKRLIVFGRARGNWLERTAALSESEEGWSGPRSISSPQASADRSC